MTNNNEKNNYYEVLEIEPSATLQDIHNAYIRSKNAYSDDSVALYSLMSQEECNRIIEQIEEAYSILGVAEKRRDYDSARGLNQDKTQKGFNEEIMSRPSYLPQNSLTDMINDTKKTQTQNHNNLRKEEYQYTQEHSLKHESHVSKVHAFKKFGLSFEEDSLMEQEIDNCNHFTGEFLAKIREYKQVSIERMVEMTKISKTYIRNIESDDFSKLPADVYTRGFVYQYAKCLKLNPDLVATSYINHLRQLKKPNS